MKKRWKLWVSLGALLLAALACAWTFGPSAEAPAPETAVSAEAPTYTMIYERDLAKLGRIEVSGAGFATYAVRSDLVYDGSGNLLGVNNALGQPVVLEGRESFRFATYAYQMLLLVAQHLPSVGALDAAGERSALGLGEIVCRAEYADGETLTVRVGSLTPTGDNCYVSVDGDAAVYLVPADLRATLIGGLEGMHALPTTLGFTAAQVTRMEIERPGEEPLLVEKKADSSALVPYRLTQPFVHDVSEARLSAALESLCAALPTSYAGCAGTDAERAAYGLDAPALRLTLVIENQYLAQLVIGGDAADGRAYCTLDRSGDVYLAEKRKLAFADSLTAEGLLERYLSLVPVTDVSRVAAAAGGKSRELALVWGEDATRADEYRVDGEAVEREAFTALYQRLIAPMFDKLAPEAAAPGAEKLLLAFTLRDGTARAIRYFAYDDFYDLAATDGGARLLVRTGKTDALIAALWPDG